MARCKRAEEIKCKAGEKRILEENDGICNGAAVADENREVEWS